VVVVVAVVVVIVVVVVVVVVVTIHAFFHNFKASHPRCVSRILSSTCFPVYYSYFVCLTYKLRFDLNCYYAPLAPRCYRKNRGCSVMS